MAHNMVKDYFTAEDIADILDIDIISAHELLDGTIDFEVTELFELAKSADLTMEQLFR